MAITNHSKSCDSVKLCLNDFRFMLIAAFPFLLDFCITQNRFFFVTDDVNSGKQKFDNERQPNYRTN